MLFGQDRQELRQMYADAWQKFIRDESLSPLETQIARVIQDHPEYHAVVSGAELDADYAPESGQSNPFLHMGLHLAVREQVATNRPIGILDIFHLLIKQTGDALEAEHRMLECLAETLWEAQTQNTAPDEKRYVARLRKLAG